jgi:signal transduction histidine kinase
MIQLQQFEEWVTGSKLNKQFRHFRIKLQFLISVGLFLILMISNFTSLYFLQNDLEGNRRGQTIIENRILKPRLRQEFGMSAIDNFAQNLDLALLENRRETIEKIIFNNIYLNLTLLIILSIVSWFMLYFLIKPIQEYNDKKSKLLERSSHELRTPLAIINSLVSSLNSNTKNSKNQESIDKIKAEIKKLQAITDLNLQEYEFDKSKIKDQVFLSDFINEIWHRITEIKQKNLTFTNLVNENVILKTEKNIFAQIVMNILDNAYKYSDENSEIIIKIIEVDKWVSLTVKNKISNLDLKEGVGMKIIKESSKKLGLQSSYEIEENNFIFKLEIDNKYIQYS